MSYIKPMNNLDKSYQNLLQDILENGIHKQDRTGTGTISVFGRQIRHKMSDGFPMLTTKKVPFKTMATELMWFLMGDTNIKYLVDNGCHIWDGDVYKSYENWYDGVAVHSPFGEVPRMTKENFIKAISIDKNWAAGWGDLGPIYGKQWRKWVGQDRTTNGSLSASTTFGYVDQIQNLINDLKTNPDSRRLMVSAWNVGELDQMVLPPCHYGFQVYTRELNLDERVEILRSITDPFNFHSDYFHEHLDYYKIPRRAISLMWNQRSVDTFLGLPFNIASYGLLLEIIAKMVNMVPDELIGNLGDTHLYLNHIEQAKEQIERKSFDLLPTLNINTEFWPTETGECGIGPLDTTAILNSFKDDNFCKSLLEEDLQLVNYQSHPAIKAPLSN